MQDQLKPINSPDGQFHDGNPYTGELGTVVTSEWLNGMQSAVQSAQQEMMTLLKTSGQNPDPSRKDQLQQAVQNIAWGGNSKPTTLAGYGIVDGASKTDLQTAVNNLVANAPGALNTLQELAAALGNDANYAASVTKQLSNKADKATTLAGYGIADAMKASDWGVQGYTTLQVGPGKPFAGIQDAWNSLIGKVLQADVLIQVADGQYTTSGIWLNNQPFASRIRIQGNVANPSACKIILTPDGNKLSHGVIFSRVHGVNFSGFHIVGEANASHWSYRCLRIEEGSVVYSTAGSIVLEGASNGLETDQNARAVFDQIRVLNCKGWAAIISGGSYVSMQKCVMTGLGKNVQTTPPAFVDPDMAPITSYGLGCQDGSKVWAADSRISNVNKGCFSVRNAYIWCDGTAVDQADVGFHAQFGGICWSGGSVPCASLPQGRRSKASNCRIGYQAEWGGIMYAEMATAENCAYGFFSNINSTMQTNNGWARSCTTMGYHADGSSLIHAYSTDTNGSAGSYDPNQTFNNWNSIVFNR
ncbi:hypothetical protein CFN79_04400 [Chromobacterium vaccinii]|uniref:hypothetical protein n=1 Tax=Chromobacterium vaccinii TaxID=1108595 RepID=UPI000CE9553B|nr:hypothetical protein [Chromobacterium vaccinii]AVG15161.1 hypothetical protein CFN79_04400 [Chromobacterium vaccinii]